MNTTGFIIIILLATFTGWFITWIATTICFHPIKPIRFLGITIQGLLPKKQSMLAEKLSQAVSNELRSFDFIGEKITNAENLQKIKPDIEVHIDHFLRHKLKEVFPMLGMMMGEKTILQLKDAFLAELDILFPVVMKNYVDKLQQDLDLEDIIMEKMTAFSSEKLEVMLKQQMKKEFRQVQLAGLLIGFTMGLVQVAAALLIQNKI